MTSHERHLEALAESMREHAADSGHCQEFRDQLIRDIPKVERELAELRANR